MKSLKEVDNLFLTLDQIANELFSEDVELESINSTRLNVLEYLFSNDNSDISKKYNIVVVDEPAPTNINLVEAVSSKNTIKVIHNNSEFEIQRQFFMDFNGSISIELDFDKVY